jgi:hypothetical protein
MMIQVLLLSITTADFSDICIEHDKKAESKMKSTAV